MRILFLTIGDEKFASSRTRVFQYLPHLKQFGYEYKVIKYESGNLAWIVGNVNTNHLFGKLIYFALIKINLLFDYLHRKINLLVFVNKITDFDVVFIQKVLLPVKYHKYLKLKPLVFDFDDALYADDFYAKSLFDRTLKISNLVVLENNETASYVKKFHNNILKITGPIDCDRYKPSAKDKTNKFCIGWIGSSSTTKFIRIIEEPLRKLNSKYPGLILFKCIGAINYFPDGIDVQCVKWSLDSEFEELETFDVGVMPLFDDEFTRGKGGYKLLQYMAMGIPSVCSPVGINSEIIVNGVNGFNANSENEWFDFLELLFLDLSLRKNLGENSRGIALKKYSFNYYTNILVNAISNITTNE